MAGGAMLRFDATWGLDVMFGLDMMT